MISSEPVVQIDINF